MTELACLFPGQGSQSQGMGRDLYDHLEAARTAFAAVDAAAGRSLSALCFGGAEAELKRTVNTQPAVLAVSLAAWAAYRAAGGPLPAYCAGHSLGEITALVASSCLSLSTAVDLVEKRASLMEASPTGTMAAVIGIGAGQLESICGLARDRTGACVIVANFNTKEQLVISGDPAAVAEAGSLARKEKARVIPLPVGGAFHSPLMAQAAETFARHVAAVEFRDAACPVVQNVDARPAAEAAVVKAKLSRQMASCVRWCETIEFMLGQGVSTFVEIGPGKALAGMVKKIDRQARVFNVYDPESLSETIAALAELQPA